MQNLFVKISSELIEIGLTTGFNIERSKIKKGLPDDAELKVASLDETNTLVLHFQSESLEGPDDYILIEIEKK